MKRPIGADTEAKSEQNWGKTDAEPESNAGSGREERVKAMDNRRMDGAGPRGGRVSDSR